MKWAIPCALAVVLAGCTGPVIPDDAIELHYDGLPGATMWAWLDDESANFTVIHGHFEYGGEELLHTDWKSPRGAWNLTIENEDGEEIIFDKRPGRKSHYQPEGYTHEESFQLTWLHEAYERYELAGTHEDIPRHPVPSGNYTATLAFGIAGEPADALQAVMTFVVA